MKQTTYIYISFVAIILLLTVAYFVFNTMYNDSKCDPETQSCYIQLSYPIMGTLTWMMFLIIRRIAIGQNFFFKGDDVYKTSIEAFVGGILWGIFFILCDIVKKIRQTNSKHIGTWKNISFQI